MNKRLPFLVAFLLLWGEATAQVNTWRWVERTSPKKPEVVLIPALPPIELEDVPLPEEAEEIMEEKPSARKSVPRYQTITAEDIDSRKSRDVAEALTSLGMQVVASGGKGTQSTLIYKGYSGFDIKVYVDGVLANSTTTGEFDWNSLDISTIDSITVVEIPAGQSEFAGCIIYIRTKKTLFSSILLSTSLSSFVSKDKRNWVDGNETKFYVTNKVKNHSYSLSGNQSFDKNEYFRNVSTPVNWDNFDRLINYQGTYTYENDKLSNSVTGRYSNNYLKAYSTGQLLSVGMEQDHILSLQDNFSYNLNSWVISSTVQFRYDSVSYSRNRSMSLFDETRATLADISVDVSGPIKASVFYRNRQLFDSEHQRHEFGGSFEYTHEWDNVGLALGSSLLMYCSDVNTLKVEPLPYVSIYGSFWSISAYRAFVLPTFNQLYWGDLGYAKGNPDLKPESGWGTSIRLGSEQIPVWCNFTGSYYSEKIRWIYQGWRMTPANTSYTWLFSAQVGFNWVVPHTKEHLKINGDCTYTRSWLQGDFRQIMWVPEWKAHADIQIKFNKFSSVLDCTYMGARYISNLNYAQYPAYLIFNSTLTFEPMSGVSLFLKVNNLLDIRVVHHDGYFIPSRNIVLGLQFSK